MDNESNGEALLNFLDYNDDEPNQSSKKFGTFSKLEDNNSELSTDIRII